MSKARRLPSRRLRALVRRFAALTASENGLSAEEWERNLLGSWKRLRTNADRLAAKRQMAKVVEAIEAKQIVAATEVAAGDADRHARSVVRRLEEREE